MRVLLFDFGGTLDSDGLTWGERFFPLYREEGLAPSRDAFNKAFWKADDELPFRHDLKGLSLEKTLELQVADTLATLAPDRKDLTTKIAGRFLADCRRFFARNIPMLERLKSRYRLGIVSNFYGNVDSVLRSEKLAPYFDVVADSAVVGCTKPGKDIFMYAVGKLGVAPQDCLMIGDSLPRDMKGAESLAMPHAYLNSAADAQSCCGAALLMNRLTDLEARLT